MEINKNISMFLDALKTLKAGVDLFYEYEDIFDKQHQKEMRSFLPVCVILSFNALNIALIFFGK